MLEILGRIERIDRQMEQFSEPPPPRSDVRSRWNRVTGVRECISELSPKFDVPEHLGPYLDFLDSAVGSGRRCVFAAPPQHGKSEALAHAFISWAINNPGHRHAYATYNDDRTREILDRVRFLAFECGLDPSTRKGLLRLAGGTEIKFTSVTGSLTGRPIDGVLCIDDPIKSAEDARSRRFRDMHWRFLTQTGETRMHPGAAALVMATRWHTDDLSGRCIAEGYESVRLPAIAELDDALGRAPGAALWPSLRPIDFLEAQQRRLGIHAWAAMYQGRPQAEGAKAFGAPSFFDEIPRGRSQLAYGIDCAYTAKTNSDYSVIVRVIRVEEHFYVDKVWRVQVDAPRFAALFAQAVREKPGRARWYVAGAEKGVADMLRRTVPTLRSPAATVDKYVRSAPLRAAWDDGKVLLRSGAPWLGALLEETEVFTGSGDSHDDQVDALAAAFDELDRRPVGRALETVHIPPRM